MSRSDHVVLIDEAGQPTGTMDRKTAHTGATPRHLGFSLYLLDGADRVLTTRRSLTKRTWPGVWSNTCCGHPRRGEPWAEAVVRRLGEELGLGVTDLVCALPDFTYRARDAGGLVEDEWCPTFMGRVPGGAGGPVEGALQPDPGEVMEWAWIGLADLVLAARTAPFAFTPWLVAQVQQLAPTPTGAVVQRARR